MNKLFRTLSLLAIFLASFAASAVEPDLKAYIGTGKDYLDKSNVGWQMQGNGKVCAAMKSVGIGCSYNHRVALVDFLQQNGKGMFPCKGNTNPYTVGHCGAPDADRYNYIGQPVQNEMLAKAITGNKQLFKGGNLTAANAKKWRM